MYSVLPTKDYLKAFLPKPFEEKTTFLLPYGQGEGMVNRVRTEMSRIKNKLKKENKQIIQFKIRSEVKYGATQDDPDQVTLWKSLNGAGRLASDLVDIQAALKLAMDATEEGVKQQEFKL